MFIGGEKMNKGLRDFLIILLCVVVVSIGVGGTLIKNHWGGWNFWTEKGDYHQDINKEKSIQLGSAEEIYIDSKTSKITLIPEDRQDIRVSLSGSITSFLPITEPELNLESSGNKINITLKDNFKIFTGANNIKLDVYIPKNYNKDIEVKNITGSVNIGDMTLHNLEIDTTTGKIALEDLAINKLNVSCTTGSLEVSSVKTSETKVKLTTGSGKFNDFTGDLDAKGTTGSFDIGYKEFNNDIKAVVTTGSITIRLPEKSEFKLNARATTGKISCDFPINISESSKSKLEGQVGSGNNSVDLDVTTGGISIR